jgi:ubiquinone/menaquinone biosynthesis C-methylase UbiE
MGLLKFADHVRFVLLRNKNKKENKAFLIKNPNIKLPPDYLMYESFQLNYKKYYAGGLDTAIWLADNFKKYAVLKNARILDWGCGPGRIIRHLPDIIGDDCEFYGTDYNTESINWCAEHLDGIAFNNNTLEADLPYPDNHFNLIYGISIFTHLSEKAHYEWCEELLRILDVNGILFLTTQGDNFKVKLSHDECEQYEKGALVVRGNTKEGHRTYSAFHPDTFMHALFRNVEVLKHVVKDAGDQTWIPQDIWIVRKTFG